MVQCELWLPESPSKGKKSQTLRLRHRLDGEQRVSVLSFNVALCQPSREASWNLAENTSRVVALLLAYDADIVSIQVSLLSS